MTRKEWGACAALLAAYYPTSFKMTDVAQVQAWFDALSDLEGARVHAAVLHVSQVKGAFPSIADIRHHAEAGGFTAATAWAEVIRQVGAIGRGSAPCWPDERFVVAVAAVGGWIVICDTPMKDQPTLRAQFRQAFEGASEVASRRRTFAKLGVPLDPGHLVAPAPVRELLSAAVTGERKIELPELSGAAFEVYNLLDRVLGDGQHAELESAWVRLGQALKVIA